MQNRATGGHRKGKYAPLRAVATRLGAARIVEMQPDVISRTLAAMTADPVCPAASGLLEGLLHLLRREALAAAGATCCPSYFASSALAALP